jgi:hypothetical protein
VSPRVVYLVMTHQFPELVHRLARVLVDESANAFVLIHHDHDKSALPPPVSSQVHVLGQHVPTARGDMSFVHATLRGLEWIRANLDYDWVVHISGQDYPLVPLRRVDAALAGGRYDAHLRWGRTPEAEAEARRRYTRRWYSWKIPFRRRKRITVSRPYNVVFNDRFRVYKSSQWWNLSRPVIDYALDFLSRTPGYWEQYARSFIPVESFLQTIVLNGPFEVAPWHMRYTVWAAPTDRHPQVLTVRDLPAMLASGDWFARKFNPRVCAEVLDRLDAHRREEAATAACPAG